MSCPPAQPAWASVCTLPCGRMAAPGLRCDRQESPGLERPLCCLVFRDCQYLRPLGVPPAEPAVAQAGLASLQMPGVSPTATRCPDPRPEQSWAGGSPLTVVTMLVILSTPLQGVVPWEACALHALLSL